MFKGLKRLLLTWLYIHDDNYQSLWVDRYQHSKSKVISKTDTSLGSAHTRLGVGGVFVHTNLLSRGASGNKMWDQLARSRLPPSGHVWTDKFITIAQLWINTIVQHVAKWNYLTSYINTNGFTRLNNSKCFYSL